MDMHCFWCRSEFDALTEDHIIPRALGGTSGYTVQACRGCQNRLSRAELEVSRKSVLAIHAVASSIRPRHLNRPTSGTLQPIFFLVEHPDGGYGESQLSAGEQLKLLAYFEIKALPGEPLEGRVRGTTADARRLVTAFGQILKKVVDPDELLGIKIDILADQAITSDPEFWPRIVLLPGDRLLLRGRSREELQRFLWIFQEFIRGGYEVPEKWSKADIDIPGGTPHRMALKFDPQAERRIAAKIAYALFLRLTGKALEYRTDLALRSYILDQEIPVDEPVSIEPLPLNFTTSERPHAILLSPQGDRQAGFVSLYDHKYRVELGPGAELPAPIAVLCQIDGSGISIASPEQTETIAREFLGCSFSQPWKSEPRIPESISD
jgi:hypothetical protein